MQDIANALKPYGYEWLISATGIAGPGAMIVVFAGPGDFYTACLTHDNQVVWVMTCGGQDVDASIDEVNAMHAKTREFYALRKTLPPEGIRYCSEHDNFYSAEGKGMGQGFYETWKANKHLFPTARAGAAQGDGR